MTHPTFRALAAAILATTLMSACSGAPKQDDPAPADKAQTAQTTAPAQSVPVTDPTASLWSSAGEKLSSASAITLLCTSAVPKATRPKLTRITWSRAEQKVTMVSADKQGGDSLTLNLADKTASGTVGGTPINTKPGSPLYGLYAAVWEITDHMILPARHAGPNGNARFAGEEKLNGRALAALEINTSATAALSRVKLRAFVDPATSKLAAYTIVPAESPADAPAPTPEVFEVQSHQTAHGVTIPSRVHNTSRSTTFTCNLENITP